MMPNRDALVLALIFVVVAAIGAWFVWIVVYDPVQMAHQEAGEAVSGPLSWQLNFQFPHSELQRRVYSFHNLLLAVNVAICVLVAALLVFALWRFRRSRNPEPSITTHNTVLEVLWTVVPVLILMLIAVPSFRLLAYAEQPPETEVTLKVTAHQWYWDYTYPDHNDVTFSSVMVPDDAPDRKGPRLLEVDQHAVLPVGTNILVQVTSEDVVHAFTIPALGIKRDAIPGRVSALWTNIEKEGMYYGQCSVLCGQNHAFMPIAVKAVSKEAFAAWIADKVAAKAKRKG